MVQRIEHVKLFVEDLSTAVEFYVDVMGLVELNSSSDTVYLGCGLNNRFDLAVAEGGSGLDHFALRLTEGEFEELRRRLENHGEILWHEGLEPGEVKGVQLLMPSDTTIEFVVTKSEQYQHISETAHPQRSSIAPLDLDHINLRSTSVKAEAEFLRDELDFDITEAQSVPGGEWDLAFNRLGDHHHDIGLSATEDETQSLSHVAWRMSSLEHMKFFADELARNGHQLEIGINRHHQANNLFAYFWEPGGNRFEIATEMASIEPDTPTLIQDRSETSLTSWGGVGIPETFSEGS